tara:strand:+ start:1179 stop:1463 length:285 start_codon:yes stop_codon:yes gene_type:complete
LFCSNIFRKCVGVGVRANGSSNGLSFDRRRYDTLFDNVIFSLSLPKSLDKDEDNNEDIHDEIDEELLLLSFGDEPKFIIFVAIHTRYCFFMSIL